MVAYLVDRPVDQKMAQRLGKYLALLPSGDRDESFAIIERSAPAWLVPLRETAARWRQHLGKGDQLLRPRQ